MNLVNIPQTSYEPPNKSPFSGYKENTIYEITIAPNEGYQYLRPERIIGTGLSRLEAFTRYYKSLFKKFTSYLEYNLNIEISEASYGEKVPRLHLHGTILLKDKSSIIPFLLQVLPLIQNTGRIAIADFRPDHWPTYMAKQQWIFEGTIYEPYKNINNLPRVKGNPFKQFEEHPETESSDDEL